MNSETFFLKINIDENRKIKVNTSITNEGVEADWLKFYFVHYLSSNLESAITSLISQMIEDEQSLLVESVSISGSAEEREKMIRDITSKFEKTVRKRIAENKNYLIPEEFKGKKIIDTFKEKTLFCNRFSEICEELQRENEKLTRINIAQKMFGKNSNHHQKLKRKLNDLNWNFQDVLDAFLKKQSEKLLVKSEQNT